MTFDSTYIDVFMGGDFTIENYKSVRAFRDALQKMDKELAGWGDDQELAEVVAHKGKIMVTLKDGIPR